MKLLLINTCGTEGVVGVAAAGSVLAEERLPGRGSSESLVPAVRTLLQSFGWNLRELAGVGVVTGPGSFTGMRVGLSVAKGLCEAGGVGLIALSRLALVAEAAGSGDLPRVALLAAGRGEYYGGVYEPGREAMESLMTKAEAQSWLGPFRPSIAVTCEAQVVEDLGERVRLVREPGTAEMLGMVSVHIQAGQWSDVALTDAHYLRRTDAELLAKVAAARR